MWEREGRDCIRETILHELDRMERERDVRVLLAVESGSRSWGMASEDSDYDVRFVYVRPMRDYLRLERGRDTIEWMLDETLDITGWDLTKFLRLARVSNPSVFEWLASPIVYAEASDFACVRAVAQACFSAKAHAFHYLGMARENSRDFLLRETVSAKKYLYVIRALLAARWCLDERAPAPAQLSELVAAKLPHGLCPAIEGLRAAKLAGDEHLMVAHIPDLDVWMAREDEELHARAQAEWAPQKVTWEVLDDLFLDLVTGA